MNILHTRRRQRGASAWTVVGSLLVVAGMAGFGVAWVMPGGKSAGIASAPSAGSAAPVLPAATRIGPDAPMTAATKPAAPAAAPPAVVKTDPPGSGPHPNWHGTWRGTSPDSKMVITGAGVEIFDVYENDGKKNKLHTKLPWVNTSEANGNDEESGYAKASVSIADIARRFEESVALFQRDPSDFSISDPAQSRAMIGRIKPGNYRVVWAYWGGDCGLRDMIVDGDLILSIVNCRYRHQISLFTRERVALPVVAREVPGAAGQTVVPPLPGGRWEGTVNKP